jgi:BASS family bile acid:Na+ symporter
MALQEIVVVGIKASIVLTVFALGLRATTNDLTYLLWHPGKLARSLVAMDVVMPVFAMLAISVTALPAPVKLALAALSVSPVPPMLPQKAVKAGGAEDYVVGLLVAAAVVALVFVPLSVEVLGIIFGIELHVPISTVAFLMATTVLGPLVAGVATRSLLPALAERVAGPLARVAGIGLLLCTVLVVFGAWPQMMTLVGDGTLMVFIAFVLVGLAVGHFLGGPEQADRTVLAIATGSRHPGMALAIATASFPEQKLVVPALILYLLVSMVASLPYIVWRRRQAAGQPDMSGLAD